MEAQSVEGISGLVRYAVSTSPPPAPSYLV